MRILVLTSSYPRSRSDGVAPFVRSISEHLALLGHDVEVIAPYDAGVIGASDTISVRRFRYAPFSAWHIMGHARALHGDARLRPGAFLLLPFFLVRYFVVAFSAIRQVRPDIIHAHWVLPSGLIGALVGSIFHVPVAISLHGSDMFLARKTRAFGGVARWVFRRAAVTTACSAALRQGALDLGADPAATYLVTWGADPERFSPATPPLARTAFGLGAADLIVLSLGRVVPKKGFDVLIRALPLLLSSCPSVNLIIGGDGTELSSLQQLVAELNLSQRVHFPGRITWDDVPSFLAMGDIFVLPSVRDALGNMDGLPTVLLEAMALGKPVVATDIAGVPLVLEDGVNGLLCRAGDAAALAETIARVVHDGALRERLARNARAAVEVQHNWLAVARRLSDLFSGVSPSVGGAGH